MNRSLWRWPLVGRGAFFCLAVACGSASSNAGGPSDLDGGPSDLDGGPGGDGGQPDGPAGDAGGDAKIAESCPVLPLVGPGPFSVAWTASPPAGSGHTYVASVRPDGAGNTYALFADDIGDPDFAVVKLDSSGTAIWTRRISRVKNDAGRDGSVTPAAVVVDASGAPVVVGTFTFSVDFAGDVRAAADAGNQTPNALFVMKLDAAGATTFVRTFDAVDTQVASAAIDGAGHTWLAGTYAAFSTSRDVNLGGGNLTKRGSYDAFVLEVDTAGNFASSRSYGSTGSDSVGGIAARASGGVVLGGVLGSASGTLGGGTVASAGGFVAAYNGVGALDWSVVPTTLDGHLVGLRDVATDPNGNVFVLGEPASVGRFGSTGTPGFATTLDPALKLSRVAVDPQGKMAAVGSVGAGTISLGALTFTVPTTMALGAVALRFDASGVPTAARALGGGCSRFNDSFGLESSRAGAVALETSGRLLIGASVAGYVDFGFGPKLHPSHEAVTFAVAP